MSIYIWICMHSYPSSVSPANHLGLPKTCQNTWNLLSHLRVVHTLQAHSTPWETSKAGGIWCLINDILTWYGCFQKSGYPQIINSNRAFPLNNPFLGTPIFGNTQYQSSHFWCPKSILFIFFSHLSTGTSPPEVRRIFQRLWWAHRKAAPKKFIQLVVEPTQLKNVSQNGISCPNRGEHKKYLKPPPNHSLSTKGLTLIFFHIKTKLHLISRDQPALKLKFSMLNLFLRILKIYPLPAWKGWMDVPFLSLIMLPCRVQQNYYPAKLKNGHQ